MVRYFFGYFLLVLFLGQTPSSAKAYPVCKEIFQKVRNLKDQFHRKSIVFEEESPTDFYNYTLPGFANVPRGSAVRILSLADRKELQKRVQWSSDHGQVLPNEENETLLLKKSYEEERPPTAYSNIRIFDRAGNVISSLPRPLLGSPETSGKMIFHVVWFSMDWPEGSFLIEISHVHLGYEFQYRSGTQQVEFVTSPLTQEDRDFLSSYSANHNLFVRLKAILPNGYSYQETQVRSKPVEDPLLGTKSRAAGFP